MVTDSGRSAAEQLRMVRDLVDRVVRQRMSSSLGPRTSEILADLVKAIDLLITQIDGGRPLSNVDLLQVARDERFAARALRREFSLGAHAAAAVAAQYDASSVHGHRLGNCILAKLNLRRGRPRRNTRRLQPAHDAWLAGFAAALAEVARYPGHADVKDLLRVARDAGVTLGAARRAGVAPEFLAILRRIGVPGMTSAERALAAIRRRTRAAVRRDESGGPDRPGPQRRHRRNTD